MKKDQCFLETDVSANKHRLEFQNGLKWTKTNEIKKDIIKDVKSKIESLVVFRKDIFDEVTKMNDAVKDGIKKDTHEEVEKRMDSVKTICS